MNLWILAILAVPVINEVMSNPKGQESGSLSPGDRNEFIEIYNSGDDTLDLSGFKIRDNQEEDTLLAFPDEIKNYFPEVVCDTRIPPGGYALILDREYLEQGENYIPYQIPAGTSVLTTGDTDIGNGLSSKDTIYLISPDRAVISTYGLGEGLPLNPPDGVSVERRVINEGDFIGNWAFSRSSTGCTPGYKNSISREIDIVLDSAWVERIGDGEFRIYLDVINGGLNPINNFSVTYDIFGEVERNIDVYIPPNGSLKVDFEVNDVPPGYYRVDVMLRTSGDEDTLNQKKSIDFLWDVTILVINEIMYNAENEWIELYNASDTSISLRGFRVGDMSGAVSNAMEEDFVIQAHDYAVISGDSLAARNSVTLPGFPVLNNREETIYLYTPFGFVMDSVHYFSKWGGDNGISLERLSPYLPSNSPSNWASSKCGSTPGERNSVRVDFIRSKDILSLSTKVLAPRRGRDKMVVAYNIPQAPATINLKVYRIDGKLTKTLLYNFYSTTGRGEIIWDGKSEAGKLEGGIYIIVLKAVTRNGRIYKTKKVIAIAL